jgi:hypothetical protein
MVKECVMVKKQQDQTVKLGHPIPARSGQAIEDA